MPYELIQLCYEGDFATITMNHPQRRNALSLELMGSGTFLRIRRRSSVWHIAWTRLAKRKSRSERTASSSTLRPCA